MIVRNKRSEVTLESLIENNIERLHYFLLITNICLLDATPAQREYIIKEFSKSFSLHEAMQAAISAGLAEPQTNFVEIFKNFLETSAETRAVPMTTFYISLMHTVQTFKSQNYHASRLISYKAMVDKSEDEKAIVDFATKARNIREIPQRLINLIYDNKTYIEIYEWACEKDKQNSEVVIEKKKEEDSLDNSVIKFITMVVPVIFFTIIYTGLHAIRSYSTTVQNAVEAARPYIVNGPVSYFVFFLMLFVYPLRMFIQRRNLEKEMAVNQEIRAINEFKEQQKNDMEILAELLNKHFNIKVVEFESIDKKENTTALKLESSSLSKTFHETKPLKEEPKRQRVKPTKHVRLYTSEKVVGNGIKSNTRTPMQIEYESSDTQIIRRIQSNGFKTTLRLDKNVKQQILDKTTYKSFKRAFTHGKFAHSKGGNGISLVINHADYDAEIKVIGSEYRIFGKKTVTDQGTTYDFKHYRKGLRHH